MALRALLLDVDDTLVDTRGAFRAAITAVVGTWLPHLDADGREAAVQRWALDPGGHFRAYTRGEVDFETQRRRRAGTCTRPSAGRLDDARRGSWDAALRGRIPERLAALSGRAAVPCRGPGGRAARGRGDEHADQLSGRQARRRGSGGFVAAVIGLDVVGVGKPDPRPFLHACALLGVEPGEAAYVGDELDVDARAARDAGLLGVWLDRHGTGLEPGDVPVVRTLVELPALLGLVPATRQLIWVRPCGAPVQFSVGTGPAPTGACTPMGYGVIGSTTDSGSVSLGSSPGTPARLLRACTVGFPGPHGPVV